MEHNNSVGKKIRLYREYRGFNQIELAELSHINVGTIRKYELGLRNPKPDQLEKIATALGLNVRQEWQRLSNFFMKRRIIRNC